MTPLQSPTMSMNEIVEFNVVTKGGKNIKRILRNALLRSYQEVTVYGYKGEKVKHALKRDGRFLKRVFDKTCALSEIDTNVELSNLVNDLGGKTFQIIMLNRNAPPESQQSLDESVMNEDSSSSDLENENHLEQNKQELHEIPGYEVFRSHLLSRLSDCLKRMLTSITGQVSDVRNLLSLKYGRSQGSFTASAMTELMSLKHSVCQVRIKGRGVGSGFLLFDTFVLTNYHVIEHVFNSMTGQLFEIVTVDFSFEHVGDCSEEHRVQEVVAFEYWSDESGQKCDWALLSLTTDPQFLPDSLLPHCGFRRQSDSICIIGHPGGNVKMVDSTWVIPVDHHEQIIERHFNENLKDSKTVPVIVSGEVIQFVTSEFANIVAKTVSNTRDLSYETCFYHGASGSPVFDGNCNVVAMHSGGYVYQHSSGQIQSVIEYGHPLSSILENLIIQLVHRYRLDVLKKYLESPYKHHESIKHNVKKLVDSRNDTTFKSAINNFNIWNDCTLGRNGEEKV